LSDYCTLVEVKQELGIAPTDTTDDSRISASVSGVSRAIEKFCRRRFYAVQETRYYTPVPTNSTPRFEYPSGYTLDYALGFAAWIVVDDVLSVASLATDDNSRTYSTVWAPTDYDLEPANNPADGLPYWQIVPTPNGHFGFTVGIRRGVKVDGLFGFSVTPPDDVRQAALYQVMLQFRGKDAPTGAWGGGTVRQEVTASALHPFTKRLLTPYRKIT
jgi:hypothetical protein